MPAFSDALVGGDVVEVSLGGSTILPVGGGAGRVTLTDPSIADVSAANAGLLVVGRRVGETNLIVAGPSSQTTYLVKVTLPSRAIQSELALAFGREDIEARAVGGAIVLTGTVTSTNVLDQAEELTLGYLTSPSFAALGVTPKVINLLRVKQRQQVLVQVKFAEVTRKSIRAIGAHGHVAKANGRVSYTQGDVSFSDLANGAGQRATIDRTGAMSSIAVFDSGGKFPYVAALNLLAERSLSRTLAEPTLVAVSGQTARFLAGGEYPLPLEGTAFSNPSIEYKPVGVSLEFLPTVLDDDTIELTTTTAVVALDPTLNNGPLSGFKTRSSTTTVRLRDTQSFAIAGVLSDEMENTFRSMPGLGSIPIIGTLFSSKDFERRETELVIVVTARLTEPLEQGQVPILPGEDRVSDPSDIELFLLNISDPNGPNESARPSSGPQRKPIDEAPELESSLRKTRLPSGVVGFWR